ncbi:hypothetical protein [Cellulomonas septica]|uniref:Lipoprotein n=1 Tax=Cellulomonas septica TaxID=285080 RepID=A0ABX1K0X8_9CELL|nr:hypothetical protein [Cellulomonas septica]NKY39947.1 hypothetical protein [Cellulomonas septica]
MRATVRTTVTIVCAGLLLAACTTPEPEPTPAAATSAAPSPTPTPTPTASGPIDRSDDALGIRFEDLPDVTGDARAALDVYTLFEVEFWRSTTDGAVAGTLEAVAAPAVLDVVRTQVDGNAGFDVGGQTSVRFLDVQADAATATIRTCNDSTGAVVTLADGTTRTGAEVGAAPAVVVTGMTKTPDLPWQVTTTDNTGEPC